MNERIKLLAEQAKPLDKNGQKVRGLNSEYHDQWMEKFAELIVKECLNNMNNEDGDLDFAIWKTKNDFGIE